jgi:tRNA (cmo5U34)-methyltransferase
MLVEMTKAEGARVLDLGCGTGILSEFVLTRSPTASVTLFDQSAEMLEVATDRLQPYTITTAQGSFDESLPAGPFDAVISALAIHHLGDEQKARLIHRVTGTLADGGVLINADQVAGASSWHADVYRAMHEKQARELGTSDAEWSAAVQRMSIDLYATVDWHLARFSETGLCRCDTFFKRFGFAVMAGWKQAA